MPKGIKKAVAPPLSVPDALERFKDFPAIDVISRRFENPNDPGSLPILLKDEDRHSCINSEHQNRLKPGATKCHLCKKPARQWYVRWFNLSQEGRNAQMRAKGYIKVEVKELQDADDVSDLIKDGDRFVRRGDKGQEVLAKMPLEIYTEIKRRQRAERETRALSVRQLKSDLAEAAGREHGSEAGDLVHSGIRVESVTREKTTLSEEAAGDQES